MALTPFIKRCGFKTPQLITLGVLPEFYGGQPRRSVHEVEHEIRQDPFSLMRIEGFEWSTSDRIAVHVLNLPVNDWRRMKAASHAALRDKDWTDGSCCFTPRAVAMRMSFFLEKHRPPWDDKKAYADKITVATGAGIEAAINARHLAEYSGVLWLPEILRAEETAGIFANQAHVHDQPSGNIQYKIPSHFITEQANAVRKILSHRMSVLTGPPGSGKTAVIAALPDLRECILLAPTNKAVVIMKEAASGHIARTLHSFYGRYCRLKRTIAEGGRDAEDAHDELCSMHGKLIVIDEATMVDVVMFSWVCSVADDLDSSVVLIGDRNQLQSIGPGQVFYDLIASSEIPVAELTVNHRSAGTGIATAAELILTGESPPNGSPDYHTSYSPKSESVIEDCITRIEYWRTSGDPIGRAPVLTWMVDCRKKLNTELQQRLNPSGKEWRAGNGSRTKKLRVGDPVVSTENIREEEISKSDRGIITGIEEEPDGRHTITVQYPRRTHVYKERRNEREPDEFGWIELGYAVTVHVSQGSEYPDVIVCLPFASRRCERSLFYTAVTRGKNRVAVFSTKDAVEQVVSNNCSGARKTLLKERIHA